jgi:sodium/hydrogen antiporter
VRILSVAEGEFWFGDVFAVALVGAAVALFVAIAALSHAHERPFSAALIYLLMGFAADAAIPGVGLTMEDDHEFVEYASAIAIAVALFTTGMRVRRPLRDRGWLVPARLLGLAMPVTIALIAAWGWGVMGLGLGAAIVLGAILAPTDPVLAGSLGVRPPGETLDEEARDREFAISSEAGLNDGLALPFLALGLLIAEDKLGERLGGFLAVNGVYATVLALVFGYLAGRALAAATVVLRRRELLLADFDPWIGVAAAPLVYGLAELLSLYGFLAVVAAGYAYRHREVDHEALQRVHGGSHSAQVLLELAIVLLLGVLVTFDGLSMPGVSGWLLIPVLFLLIRPLAVIVSTMGSGLDRADRGFLAWFGVKGVASINYLAIAVAAGVIGANDLDKVVWTALIAVFASIFVHGVSATPVMRRLDAGEEA